MSYNCLNDYNTNKTLEYTFRFIYENQNLPDDKFYLTYLYLGISLKESLNLENYNDRSISFNIIYGKII